MKRKMSMDEFLRKYWPRVSDEEIEAAGERIWKRIEAELEQHDTSLWSLSGDGWSVPALKQREFQVLTAVAVLGGRSNIDAITDMVEDWVGGTMIGKVYTTLRDLEKQGFVTFHKAASADRRGPQQHRYEVTEYGDRALRRAKLEGRQLVAAEDGWSLKDFLKGALRIK